MSKPPSVCRMINTHAKIPQKRTTHDSVELRSGSMIPMSLNAFQSVYDDVQMDEFTVQYLEAGMMAAALEDAIWSLNILEQCNSEMDIQTTMLEMDKLVALKFSVEQPPCTDELAGMKPQLIHCDQYKLAKLKTDRKLLLNALFPIYTSLAVKLNFKPLRDFNQKLSTKNETLNGIVKDDETYRMQLKELHKRHRSQRNKQNASVYDCDTKIDRLRRLIEDAQLTDETKTRYVGKWQDARSEQYEHTLMTKDRLYEESIEQYKLKIDREMRVHAESELHVHILIDETLKEVEHWMSKYDTDMEEIDLKIQVKRTQHQTMLDRRIYLEDLFAKHDESIKAWKKFKEDRTRANEYFNKMTMSAIIVQAWWRGLLVRKELGPYRVSKAKKGGKKKKPAEME